MRPSDKRLAIINVLTTGDTQESINQHLYIISDEEIKEGDWYVANNTIFRADDVFNDGNNPNIHKYRKVIATTDQDLPLPKVTPAFIEAYVKAYDNGSPITDVSVEYMELLINPDKEGFVEVVGFGKVHKDNFPLLKVRTDNTIITHQVKMYTLDDMKKACAVGIDICAAHDPEKGNNFQPFEDLIISLDK